MIAGGKGIDPDTANGRAWVLTFGNDGLDHRQSVWAMIQRISPVPLIEAWCEPVLAALGEKIVTDLNAKATWPALGPIQASLIDLGEHFTQAISLLVKNRVLTRQADASETTPQELSLAA